MTQPETIARTLSERRHELAPFQVKSLWMFGSASRRDPDARDIDLLVEFTDSPSLVEFVRLKEHLESILGRPVDLVSKRGCKERFLSQISADLRHVA